MGATVNQCVVRIGDAAKARRVLDGQSWFGWILREFSRFGVTDFLLLTDAVLPQCQASLPIQVSVRQFAPPAGSGSGGALFNVREHLQDRFLLYDESAPLDWNFAGLLADAATDSTGVVGRIVQFNDGTNHGIGLFRKELVGHLRPVCCLEADVLPDLARRGLLKVTMGYRQCPNMRRSEPDRDVTSDIVARLHRKALFLDRDGVLNIDHGYVGSRDQFEWMDGALAAIRSATAAGWHVFVVTNQSGVARGLYTEDAVRDLLGWMADQTRAAGGTIDDVRFCPFHPEALLEAYRQVHPWRKPLPGMVLDLLAAWDLLPERAVMIGDQASDMAAAAAAGVEGFLFPGGNLFDFLQPILNLRS